MLISGGKVIAIDEINHDNTLSGDGLFNPLGVNIDAIGKPLTYSGSKSVADINELDNIKVGTVYTISGEPGTITAGNFDVIQGDEIAWGGDPAQWFNIGKDKVNSWKQWSEEHGSTGDENSVYIGKNLSATKSFIIGENESATCNGEPSFKFNYPEVTGNYIANYIKNANGYRTIPDVIPGASIYNGNISSGVMLQFSIRDYYFSGAKYDNNGEIYEFAGLTECNRQSPITFINDIEQANTVQQEIDTNGSALYNGKVVTAVLTYTSEQAKTEFLAKCNDLCNTVTAIQYDTHKYVFGSNNTDNGENSNIVIGELNDISADVASQYSQPKNNKINIGISNKVSASTNIIGSNNTAKKTDLVIGDNNNINYSHIVLGNTNTAYDADILIGYGNAFDYGICVGVRNQYIGDDEGVILGYRNTIGADALAVGYGNYAGYAKVFGSDNSASYGYIVGANNDAVDSFTKFILGADNKVSGQSVVLGWVNSARMAAGSWQAQNHIFGVHNDVSGGFVIGYNNNVSSDSNDTFVIGASNNSITGGYTFGSANKITGYGGSVVLGHNNTINRGGFTLGSYNSGDYGHRIVGESNTASYGGWTFGRGNLVKNGSFTIGESNSASYGGGTIGAGNIGGKGGWVIGYGNLIKKYNNGTSSYEQITELTYNTLPTQYALGSGNILNTITSQYMGLPLQLGYNNNVYEQIQYEGTTYDNKIGGQPFAIYNIGCYNSAVNHGINIGTSNIILRGDGSVAASINIGKYLVNRYGVLIGQNISSDGYGIGLGDNINSVNAGDTIIGTNIITNSGVYGKLPWNGTSRTLIGRYLSGYYFYDSTVLGSYISAFSGQVPNRPYYCYNGVGACSILIGSHIKGGVGGGSILIGQNASNDAAQDVYGNIVPVVVTGDSNVFGGYMNQQDQENYYRNPGIYASYGSTIIGQGQQMSAESNSMIFGNQSIAKWGSQVIGTHGLAEGGSMVLNPSPMSYNSVSVNVLNINGTILTASPEIYGSYTAQGIYYKTSLNGSYTTKKFTPSGETLRKRIGNSTYYYSFFNKTNATDENLSFFAFNFITTNYPSWYFTQVRGYWNSDYTVFIPDNSYGYNAREIPWSKGAFLLLRENGVNTLYEYNENTSGNGKFPKYARNSDYWYYYSEYSNESTYGAGKLIPPNVLSNSIISDGTYIYYIPTWQMGNGSRGWDNISSNIPTAFSGSYCYQASAAYFNNDNTVDLNVPQTITSYGFNGVSGQISNTNSSVYPSALFKEVSAMITDTTARYGSISIGQKNSAYGGSIAINTQDQSKNNGSYTAAHYIKYNTTQNSSFYVYKLDSNGNVTSNTKSLPMYNSAGFDLSADATNIAEGASVAIGVGNYDKNIVQYGSLGIGKNISAQGEGFAIGKNVTAGYDSYSFGRTASAINNSMAINYYNSGPLAEANARSLAIGSNASAIEDSIVLNNLDMFNGNRRASYGYKAGFAVGYGNTAYLNSFTFGGGQYATNGSIAIGLKGGSPYYYPSDKYAPIFGWNGNVANEFSMALGYQNFADQQSYVLGFNNTVRYNAFAVGFNNYLWGMGIALGYGNCDWINSGYNDNNIADCRDFIGRWNLIVGSRYYNTATENYASVTYETTMVGNNNKLIITAFNPDGTSAYEGNYNFAGIFLGKQNECYLANPGGYNIYLGSGNKGAYEAINIGTDNDTMGHSIGLGWHNRAVKGGYSHAIMLGSNNKSTSNEQYIDEKYLTIWTYNHYSEEEIENAHNRITAVQNEISTAGLNDVFAILTANGMNNSDASEYLYQFEPFEMTIKYDYSSWWIYGTRNYGEYYVADGYATQYYNYPAISAQRFRELFEVASAIFADYYGSNSATRWDFYSNYRTEYTAAKQNYDTITSTNNTNTSAKEYILPETNNFIVGNNNTANHYNSYLFGSNNISLNGLNEYSEQDYNDDGFTLAFGLGNTVARNYDIAIGYGILASGGENLVIGTPQADDYTERYNTQAIGYKNISIRSTVTGVNNILFGSVLSSKNILLDYVSDNFVRNSCISAEFVDKYDSFNNNIIDNVHHLYIGSGYDIKPSQQHIDSNIFRNINYGEYYEPNTIYGNWLRNEIQNVGCLSGIKCNDVEYNIIKNIFNADFSADILQHNTFNLTTILGNFYSIRDNITFKTTINGVENPPISLGGSQFVDNFMFGTNATDVIGSFSFTDGSQGGEGQLMFAKRLWNFGDNSIVGASESLVAGCCNNLNGIQRTQILGNYNNVGQICPMNDKTLIAETFIEGCGNNIIGQSNTEETTINRFKLLGNNNKITPTRNVSDINILGNSNEITYFDNISNDFIYSNSYNHLNTLYNIPIININNFIADKKAENDYRINIFGTSNKVSQCLANVNIIGDSNFVHTDISMNTLTTPNSAGAAFDNINVIGNNNIALEGSNQFNVGICNITSGHYSFALGEYLRSNTTQMIVGKYNAPVDGTTRSTSAYVNGSVVELPNSGVVFAVGNGRLNAYEKLNNDGWPTWYDENGNKISETLESNITRSNAMIVSANGTVSAGNFATSSFNDINATLNTLTNFGSWEIVNGTTTADITNPNNKTIYLIKNTAVTGSDQYEEWICTNTATPAYEKIGDTSIDLSQYVPLTSYQALENRVAQLETLLTTYSARWVLTQV